MEQFWPTFRLPRKDKQVVIFPKFMFEQCQALLFGRFEGDGESSFCERSKVSLRFRNRMVMTWNAPFKSFQSCEYLSCSDFSSLITSNRLPLLLKERARLHRAEKKKKENHRISKN